MDNLQITTLCEASLVLVKYDKKRREWYAERACDGVQSPRYRDLGVLAEDLRDAGGSDDFWRVSQEQAAGAAERAPTLQGTAV
jgi:hypothetical protein